MTKKLFFILGRQKSGTTFLFHALNVDWRPSSKDGSWSTIKKQVIKFSKCNKSIQTGVIAKADALLDEDQIRRITNSHDWIPSNVHLEYVVLGRDFPELSQSYIAHRRKINPFERIKTTVKRISKNQNIEKISLDMIRNTNITIHEIDYSDLFTNEANIDGIEVRKIDRKYNSRHEKLPFFALIAFFVDTPLYLRWKDSSALRTLRMLYYRVFTSSSGKELYFLRCAVFGSLDRVDGQSLLTSCFVKNSAYSIVRYPFDRHKDWFGILVYIYQLVDILLRCIFRGQDIFYLAISRSRAGLIRESVIVLIGKMFSIPIIAHIHGSDFEEFYSDCKGYATLKKFMLKSIDRFISLAPLSKDMPYGVADRNLVLRNPRRSINCMEKKPQQVIGDFCVGWISMFLPGKGLEPFLQIASSFEDRKIDFFVAGGIHPSEMDYGKKCLAKLESSQNSEFLGLVANSGQLFLKVNIFCFLSEYRSEAFPGVVVESMSYGVVPLVKNQPFLKRAFGDAPIIWVSGVEDAIEHINYFSTQRIELEARSQRCIDWVQAALLNEKTWVKKIDEYLFQRLIDG